MRIAATSDLHGHLPEIPECDVLLIAGDICPARNHAVLWQATWLEAVFNPWLESLGVPVFITWGNHDFVGEHPEAVPRLACMILNDELVEYEGLTIFGCPHTREFFNWAFMLTEDEINDHHRCMPKADIMMTHGPPFSFGDRVPRGPTAFENVGSKGLMEYIVSNEPKLVVGGHIHCAQGARALGNTIIANVSYVDERYQPYSPPQVFEIEV